MVISRNFKPGFRIRLHQKDLRNALRRYRYPALCAPWLVITIFIANRSSGSTINTVRAHGGEHLQMIER
jgi:3-hydroxyisobutyrate dehydrogenase-like beta-hydroxyacid dehydrogenase